MSTNDTIESQIKAELERLKCLIQEIEKLHSQLKTQSVPQTEDSVPVDLDRMIQNQFETFYTEKNLKINQTRDVGLDKLETLMFEVRLLKKELESKMSNNRDWHQKIEQQEKTLSRIQSDTRIMGNMTILILAALLFIFIYVISRLN